MSDYHDAPEIWEPASGFVTCQVCEWRHPSSDINPQIRQVAEGMAVIHVMLKHPRLYTDATGKHPEAELPKRLSPDPDVRAQQLLVATADDPLAYLIEIGAVKPA